MLTTREVAALERGERVTIHERAANGIRFRISAAVAWTEDHGDHVRLAYVSGGEFADTTLWRGDRARPGFGVERTNGGTR